MCMVALDGVCMHTWMMTGIAWALYIAFQVLRAALFSYTPFYGLHLLLFSILRNISLCSLVDWDLYVVANTITSNNYGYDFWNNTL
jgi:hypothetical protein